MSMKKSAVIYLDESGDLGWSFGAPYRSGGSSRYLTISAIITSNEDKTNYFPKRLIKKLYQKFSWDPNIEMKWAEMSSNERLYFAKKASGMINSHSSIEACAITVYKPKVKEHLRRNPNALYNFMIKLLLVNRMSRFDKVLFHPDPRSIKVESANSLHDYLQINLSCELEAPTILVTNPQDSNKNKGVQFADMLSGVVQQHYSEGKVIL